MSKRQVAWARQQADRLRRQLGGVCACCGYPGAVEFDCVRPKGIQHHGMGFTWRMSFYRQQFKARNLQLLCRECNGAKGGKSQEEFIRWLTTPKGRDHLLSRIKASAHYQQAIEDVADEELAKL